MYVIFSRSRICLALTLTELPVSTGNTVEPPMVGR